MSPFLGVCVCVQVVDALEKLQEAEKERRRKKAEDEAKGNISKGKLKRQELQEARERKQRQAVEHRKQLAEQGPCPEGVQVIEEDSSSDSYETDSSGDSSHGDLDAAAEKRRMARLLMRDPNASSGSDSNGSSDDGSSGSESVLSMIVSKELVQGCLCRSGVAGSCGTQSLLLLLCCCCCCCAAAWCCCAPCAALCRKYDREEYKKFVAKWEDRGRRKAVKRDRVGCLGLPCGSSVGMCCRREHTCQRLSVLQSEISEVLPAEDSTAQHSTTQPCSAYRCTPQQLPPEPLPARRLLAETWHKRGQDKGAGGKGRSRQPARGRVDAVMLRAALRSLAICLLDHRP